MVSKQCWSMKKHHRTEEKTISEEKKTKNNRPKRQLIGLYFRSIVDLSSKR